MSKLGPHVSGINRQGMGEMLKACHDAGSPMPLIYALNQNVKDDIVRYSPSTKLVYRDDRFGVDPFTNAFYAGTLDNAYRAGIAWVDKYKGVWFKNPADWYGMVNEPGVHTRKAYELYNAFMQGAMTRANEIGVKLALYGWSTGCPDLTLWLSIPSTLSALRMAKAGGHVLEMHEYSLVGPMMTNTQNVAARVLSAFKTLATSQAVGVVMPATSLVKRLTSALAGHSPLVLRYPDLWNALPVDARCDIVLGEVGPNAGYGAGLSGQPYVDDVAAYDSKVMTHPYVIGAALFDVGNAESNLREAFGPLTQYVRTHPTPPPVVDPPIDPPPAPPVVTIEMFNALEARVEALEGQGVNHG